MSLSKVIYVGVMVLVCCIALSAILPDVFFAWYATDTGGMVWDEKPDVVGQLSWTLMPFFGLVIVVLAFAFAFRNAL